jgi:hypothetical protein
MDWLRRLTGGPGRDPYGRQFAPIYLELRSNVLSLDPSSIGIDRSDQLSILWAVLFELGYPNGTATIVAMADGTASMYTSNGGGLIGGAGRPTVAEAARRFVGLVADAAGVLAPASSFPLPEPGRVHLHARTFDGPLTGDAATADLESTGHPLSAAYAAGQDLITELRLAAEDHPGG